MCFLLRKKLRVWVSSGGGVENLYTSGFSCFLILFATGACSRTGEGLDVYYYQCRSYVTRNRAEFAGVSVD